MTVVLCGVVQCGAVRCGGCTSFGARVVVKQQGGLPAELAVEEAAGAHGEGVVVPRQQVVDPQEGLGRVAQAGGGVGHTVVHVHLITLQIVQ